MAVVVIIQRDDSARQYRTASLSGKAHKCEECGGSMDIILQEPGSAVEGLSIWWYCMDCSITSRASIDNGCIV